MLDVVTKDFEISHHLIDEASTWRNFKVKYVVLFICFLLLATVFINETKPLIRSWRSDKALNARCVGMDPNDYVCLEHLGDVFQTQEYNAEWSSYYYTRTLESLPDTSLDLKAGLARSSILMSGLQDRAASCKVTSEMLTIVLQGLNTTLERMVLTGVYRLPASGKAATVYPMILSNYVLCEALMKGLNSERNREGIAILTVARNILLDLKISDRINDKVLGHLSVVSSWKPGVIYGAEFLS
jgi:hypothetical protein